MASIRQRRGKWYCQIRKKGFNSIGKTFNSREDAEIFSASVESEMVFGKIKERDNVVLLPIDAPELRKMYQGMVKRSRDRGWSDIISYDDFLIKYRESGGVCEVSGLKFASGKLNQSRARPFFPSIDRIDQDRGYEKDNVRFVCCAVNLALNDFGEDVLNAIAFGIVSKLTLKKMDFIYGDIQKKGQLLVLSGKKEGS